MKWQRPELYDGEIEPNEGDVLYLTEPPIDWIAPFDLATISLQIIQDNALLSNAEVTQKILFKLSHYYVYVLEDQTDSIVINHIYDEEYQNWWHPESVDTYKEIAERYSLEWDTEYDLYIEETLYGYIKSEEEILDILICLRRKLDESGFRFDFFDSDPWISFNPDVDRKLEKYRDLFRQFTRYYLDLGFWL